MQKFFLAKREKPATELDFMTAVGFFECGKSAKKIKLPNSIYELLDKNKEAFVLCTQEEGFEFKKRSGRDSATKILKILKATVKKTRQFTDDQELYLKNVIQQIEEGGLPKKTAKSTLKALEDLGEGLSNPFKVLATLQTQIPERLLQSHYAESNPASSGKREVILSLYLAGE